MSDQIESGLTEEEVKTYNSALDSFIKLNANYVDFTEKSDGFTYITMRYGLAHDEVLRELALKCKNEIIDNSFVIGQFNWTIVYANSAILRFKCSTNTIATKIENDAKTDEVLFKSTTASYAENFDNDVAAYIKHYITTNATEPSNVNAELGFSFYKYGNKTHLGIDCAALNKYATSHSDDTVIVALNTVCINTIGYYTNSPKTVTELLSNALTERKLSLEKVNSKVIIFGYNPDEDTGELETTEILEAWKQAQQGEVEDPNSGNTDPSDPGTGGNDDPSQGGDDPNQNEPSGGDDPDPNDPGTGGNDDPSGTSGEFVYEKVPYSSKYMILHYGNPEFTPASADLFDVVVIRGITKSYYTGSTPDTVEMPLFVLVNKTDKSIIAADYAYPWIIDPECTLDFTARDKDHYYDVGSKEELSTEDEYDYQYRTIMGIYEGYSDYDGSSSYNQKIENILAPAKERYFNAVVSQFKKVATDHKILVKFTSPAVGEGKDVYLNDVVVNTLRKCINDEENLISSNDRTQLLDYIKNYMAKIHWGSESDVTRFNDVSVMSWLNDLDSSNYQGKDDRSTADTPLVFAIGNSDDTTITDRPTASGDGGPCYPADILNVYCGNSNIAYGGFGHNLCESTELTEDYAREYIAEALNNGEGTCRMTSQLRFGDNIIRAAYKAGRAIDIYFMK